MNEPGSEAALVKLAGVSRTYLAAGQPVPALNQIDLNLPRGVLAAIKGRSGSGKTTLLNLIGGLDSPTGGDIYFEGRALAELPEAELTQLRRRRIGFIFQSFALLPTYSAFENVELMARIAGLSRREQVERTQRCLKVVGLGQWMHHRPDEMSGGQQQRVGIARALVTQPALILADEPTGELDTATTRQIFSLFRHLVEREGITVLLSTHDPAVDAFAHVVYTIQDGKLEIETAQLN